MSRSKLSGVTEQHIRIPLAILNSNAYIALPASAAKLYLDMLSYLRSTNNGNISAALSNLRHRGWNSPTTLAKALRQLEAVGVIAKTRQTAGVHRGSKLCNLYRFTHLEAFEHPKLHVEACQATKDYLQFKSLADAMRAIKAASAAAPKEKSTIQKLQRHDTEAVSRGSIDATVSVVTPSLPSTETVASASMKEMKEPLLHKACETKRRTGAGAAQ